MQDTMHWVALQGIIIAAAAAVLVTVKPHTFEMRQNTWECVFQMWIPKTRQHIGNTFRTHQNIVLNKLEPTYEIQSRYSRILHVHCSAKRRA